MSPRIAIYAGSFDPITAGHLHVVEEAAALFDQLIVVVANNPAKQALFTVRERIEMITEAAEHLESVHAASSVGLVIEDARAHGARWLVRGLRSPEDLEQEQALAALNAALDPTIATVFIPTDPALAEVSSSRVRKLARARQPLRDIVPAGARSALERRFPCPTSK